MDQAVGLTPRWDHAGKPDPQVERAAVVIVGAGPVGLVAAIELERQGVRPVILDGKDEIAWSSRAICISRRSQEILDRIGAGPAFAAKALPWSRGRTFYRDQLVFQLDMPYGAEHRHAPFVNLQQSYTERFLLDTLAAAGDAEVRWGHRVTDLEQDGAGATLCVAGPGGPYQLRADWVVAADGGRSVIREKMGLPLHGTAYEGRYLIADIVVEGADWPVERHVWFDPPSNPGSTVILHVQPDGVWRVDYQLRDDEDADEALRDANVTTRLQAQLDMMGVRSPWRLIWKSVYKALALSLDSYRHGHVLFTGDAAHLVPIFGVRGLNSGIDDAHNLGWKLAMVARGEAPDALLDSYSHERRRATRENHEQATKSTWFMSPPGPGFKLMRDAVLSLAVDHPWASTLINPRQSSAHVYDDSPVVQPDIVRGNEGVMPGEPLPNLPVQLFDGGEPGGAANSRLQDALASRDFTLLIFLDALPDPQQAGRLVDAAARTEPPLAVVLIGSAPCLSAVEAQGVVRRVTDAHGALARHFNAMAFPLYLVRPDEHVAARLQDADPDGIAIALDIALGRVAVSPRAAEPVVHEACKPAVAPPAGKASKLGTDGLERVFEAVSRGVDATGNDNAVGLLARLALLLADEVGDADRVLALVAAARGPVGPVGPVGPAKEPGTGTVR